MSERLVAVSYPADQETETANRQIIGEEARVVFLKHLEESGRDHALEEAEVLLSWVFRRELSKELLGLARNLKFVQLLSAGVDPADLDLIPSSLVVASNVGAYSKPMAEHVMAMTLALAKRLPQRHAAMSQGRWEQHLMSLTLDGAVCGIVGYGGIGKATARLMRPFGARIWALNSSGATDDDDVEFVGTLADLDQVLTGADVLVLSIPLTRATHGLIGARELGLMKRKAILVNVARGDVIDQKALYDHLSSNEDFCAGIDTWWREPLRQGEFRTEFPFFELANLIGSPHNSSLVPGIYSSAARSAAENVVRYLRGSPPVGLVRREDYLA